MKKTERPIEDILTAKPTLEGAGVRLKRVFGYPEVPRFDPFLLLDHFGSKNPEDYMAGFPWHPHRGIETVTYMIAGQVEHGDSLGNRGVIHTGDVQWMTAGSGIIHQEMPLEDKDRMEGFQLWVNLPRREKMMRPRYRDVKATDIPTITPAEGVTMKIISGSFFNTTGPVGDIIVPIAYCDLTLSPGTRFVQPIPPDHSALAYVYRGSGNLGSGSNGEISAGQAVRFGDGGHVVLRSGSAPLSVLLISGSPLKEPVAWGGPIVMNSREELRQAFDDYHNGTFVH